MFARVRDFHHFPRTLGSLSRDQALSSLSSCFPSDTLHFICGIFDISWFPDQLVRVTLVTSALHLWRYYTRANGKPGTVTSLSFHPFFAEIAVGSGAARPRTNVFPPCYHGEWSTERPVDRGSRIGDDCAQLSAAKECVADAFSSSDFASRWETTHFSSQDWNFISLPRSWRGSTTHLWLPLLRLWVSNENTCRAGSVRVRCAFRWYRNRWSTESNVTDYYWYSRYWSWHMRYGFFEDDEWILSLN